MNANELRIGNILQDREGRVCKAEQLSSIIEDCKIMAVKGPVTSLPVSPIILSEEILLKCGFRGSDDSIFSHSRTGSIYFKKPFRESKFYMVKSIGQDKITTVQYLHQLQNLHFALTGEELEVKI
ncbi:hypothetical protein [Sphingobacterium yanglingense]|uniref:Uncharacterized protein n=1 Tax=Sphingobacterium yanglingense TaxID=1437280 RepID=A0A4R6WKU4_9SPHI|nr:hypothetical protein [Sphingobacterium yanglingense]TDQ79567.1 hypothetical protein CLV99_1012 [Sphingobacterium yanglingense]